MPTQKDVAKLAGVSHASVSRYLSNPSLVSKEKRKRIEEAINILNYKVDAAARTLKTGKTNHISILVPGSAPFYWTIIQAIQKRLSEEGYFCSMIYTREFDPLISFNSDTLNRIIHSNIVEAFIFFPLLRDEDRKMAEKIKRLHNKLIIADNSLTDPAIPHIIFDNYGAGQRAAEEIVKKGHKEILLLTGDDIFESSVMRKKGFLDKLEQLGHPENKIHIIKSGYSPQLAFPHFEKTSLPSFTAVFAANDTTAVAFIRAAYKKGLRCPDDYEIIGFDNNMEYAPYLIPSLTSFDQPTYDAGIKIAELVLDMLDNKPVPQETILPVEFIKRESFS